MDFLYLQRRHIAATFGQFPANFRFSGALVSRTNRDKLVDFRKSIFAPNQRVLAEVWILTPQRHGAGANWELLQLYRAHFLTSFWMRLHFSGQKLMHRLLSTIIFSKILRLKCTFKNLSEIYIFLVFTQFMQYCI